MSVWRDRLADRDAVVVSGAGLRATVLPGLGAKVVSLVVLASGRELLWQDPRRPSVPPRQGMDFGDGIRGGIDDCFPSVDACVWPGLEGRHRVSDHGNVWTQPWTWTQDGDEAVVLECRSSSPPFRLRRRVAVTTEGALRLDYELTNEGGQALPYQWTGHPLLAASEGMSIDLPPGVAARTGFATGGRLANGTTDWAWPSAPGTDGGSVDVSHVPCASTGVNEKYWLRAPDAGCRLLDPGRGALVLRYDPDRLPWLAVCVDHGGWPLDAPAHWVALEPSTSPYDSLDEAWAAGRAEQLEPGGTRRWWWSLAWEPAGRTAGGEASW